MRERISSSGLYLTFFLIILLLVGVGVKSRPIQEKEAVVFEALSKQSLLGAPSLEAEAWKKISKESAPLSEGIYKIVLPDNKNTYVIRFRAGVDGRVAYFYENSNTGVEYARKIGFEKIIKVDPLLSNGVVYAQILQPIGKTRGVFVQKRQTFLLQSFTGRFFLA